MAEHRNHRPEDENPLPDEQERGSAEEELDDAEEEFDEEEDADEEDLSVERDLISDATFTGEVGSEGGSDGDVEVERKRPRVTRGSESTTTGVPETDSTFRDRKSGPGF